MQGSHVSTEAVAGWCERWLGAKPESVLFRASHISEVIGLRLEDGREVVLKVRAPAERIFTCVLVQEHLWANGFPCPKPLVEPQPFGMLTATAEEFSRGGSRITAAANNPQLFALELARLVSIASSIPGLPSLDPPPYWMHWDHALEGTWPPDPDFDLNADTGPDWLEEAGRLSRARLLEANGLPVVVGHTDWESQNLRWSGNRLHVAHDWDSIARRPEATIAGAASMMYPSSGKLNEQASVSQSRAFLEAYERARGSPWTREERAVCWAVGLWVQAFKAKKANLSGSNTPLREALQREASERLRLARA